MYERNVWVKAPHHLRALATRNRPAPFLTTWPLLVYWCAVVDGNPKHKVGQWHFSLPWVRVFAAGPADCMRASALLAMPRVAPLPPPVNREKGSAWRCGKHHPLKEETCFAFLALPPRASGYNQTHTVARFGCGWPLLSCVQDILVLVVATLQAAHHHTAGLAAQPSTSLRLAWKAWRRCRGI